MTERRAGARLAVALAIVGMLPSATAAQARVDGFDRTAAMVPMRDGVRLNTVVWRPVGKTERLPILLERTPYDADWLCPIVLDRYRALVASGYVFVCQDLRGKYGSEGTFRIDAPPREGSDGTDETTDAWDTIDWLVKNVPSNGRVGMRGISYMGFTTMMALLDPHPALKAASPQASPDDDFLGDDFHHNGAFRLSYAFEYVARHEAGKVNQSFPFDNLDTYDWFLSLGGLGNVDDQYFHGSRPSWTAFVEHPNYDEYQQRLQVSRYLRRVTVPTLTVAGWWDQEDFAGPLRLYRRMEQLDTKGINYLVVGPWYHAGWVLDSTDGARLGAIRFGSPTAEYFRDSVEVRWFDYWLKDRGTLDLPEALTFRAGANRWIRHDAWPPRNGIERRRLYLAERGGLSWTPPRDSAGFEQFVSDPAKPVPYRVRPIFPLYDQRVQSTWSRWEVDDQRPASSRPDVLTYATEPLDRAVTISGEIRANLFVSTDQGDADWVVKLIDVYPAVDDEEPAMSGYQLMVANDVLRSRFRNSFEHPEPMEPGRVTPISVDLQATDYTFLPGHRIMVQVQSSWFPLIDRNPQRWVPNIYQARDADFVAAVHRVYRTSRYPSSVEVPVVLRP